MKEVVVYPNLIDFKNHPSFSKETAKALEIKKQGLTGEAAMLNYVEEMNPRKYRDWKADEFLYESDKNQYIRRVDSILNSVDIQDTFILVLPVSLNDYNFEKSAFPVVNSFLNYGKKVMNFEFDNFEDFNLISVPKDRAHFFSKINEKSYKGTRSAFVLLKVTIDDLEITEKQSGGMNIGNSSSEKQVSYLLNISEMHCVDNSTLFYNYLGGS